tara:strand:+ start:1390 stop:2358 length:969 start_codon:yes stop_codon:yes gene_type:complete
MPNQDFDLNNINLGGIQGTFSPLKAPKIRMPDLGTLPEPEYGSASTPAFPGAQTLSNLKPDLNKLETTETETIDPIEVDTPKTSVDSLYGAWSTSQSQADLAALVDYLKPQIQKSISALIGETSPAIETKAKLLTIKAIKTFDPEGGSMLTSWVYTQLQPLRRYNQQSKPVPVSERVRRRLAELNNFEEQFEENHGRPPSDSEVSDALGWSKKALEQLRKSQKSTTSYESTIPGEETDGTTRGDTVALEEDKTTEIIELFYESLSPMEQSIIEFKLGLWGKPKLSNTEIASKLGISPARVSQIANRIADDLEQFKVEYGDAI